MAKRSKPEIAAEITSKFADNTDGDITPQDARDVLGDMNDSYLVAADLPAESELPEPAEDVQEQTLKARAGVAYWEPARELPAVPGSARSVGDVLTVLDETSAGWRPVPETGGGLETVGTSDLEDGAVTLPKLSEQVRDELGVDSLARGGLSEVMAATEALNESKQDRLTQGQLVDLLQFDIVPGSIFGYQTSGQASDWLTDWRVWVSGGHTVGDVWMEMQAEGQSLLAAPAPTTPGASLRRHKLDATNIYNFTLADAQRDNLISGRTTRRQGRDLEIDLRFHDAASAGNLIDVKTIAVDWHPDYQVHIAAMSTTIERIQGVVESFAPITPVEFRLSQDRTMNSVAIPTGAKTLVLDDNRVARTEPLTLPLPWMRLRYTEAASPADYAALEALGDSHKIDMQQITRLSFAIVGDTLYYGGSINTAGVRLTWV